MHPVLVSLTWMNTPIKHFLPPPPLQRFWSYARALSLSIRPLRPSICTETCILDRYSDIGWGHWSYFETPGIIDLMNLTVRACMQATSVLETVPRGLAGFKEFVLLLTRFFFVCCWAEVHSPSAWSLFLPLVGVAYQKPENNEQQVISIYSDKDMTHRMWICVTGVNKVLMEPT